MNSQAANSIAPEVSDSVTTKRRPLLFLAAYIIGVIIATGLIAYPAIDDFSFVLHTFAAAIFFLPCGLVLAINWILNGIGMDTELIIFRGFSVTPANALVSFLIGLSYLLCFVIPFAGSLTTKQRTFRILFFTFIALLIINVGGCSMMQ
ncbi:MAG TPA: hypothetical protein VK206_21835 [Anaerolineales bacterium]|nr:hypothetical protein [Anaerolineales bacterium]HLO31287.1 hypothetical protein [Anaerolineales bacterium]